MSPSHAPFSRNEECRSWFLELSSISDWLRDNAKAFCEQAGASPAGADLLLARPLRGNLPVTAALLLTPLFFIGIQGDRKSTRLNSSHVSISYAVFCLKK